MNKENKDINVIYAADNVFLPFAGVSIYSLLFNNKMSRNSNIYILDGGISAENKKILTSSIKEFHCNIEFINVKKYLSIVENTGARRWGNGYCTYARLFIGELFKETDVKRILYIDSDTIVNGSISKLFDLNMKDYACAAVRDYISAGIRLIDGLSLNDNYYNAGVLLIDIENWEKADCQNRILDHIRNVRARYPYVDQDIINAALHDYIMTLPIQYNVFPYYSYFGFKAVRYIYDLNDKNHYTEKHYNNNLKGRKPVIIHYTATFLGKPWLEGNHDKLSKYWDKYYHLSLWKDHYKKETMNLNKMLKMQYWLSKHLNTRLYLWIHRTFARKNMLKMQKEYGTTMFCKSSKKNRI